MFRFEIVLPPSSGFLSEPAIGRDGQWGVFYTHGGSRRPGEDSFSFRCSAPGRSRSDPGRVTVAIVPPPPDLSIEPSRIEFGEVLIGDSVRKELLLKNAGGLPAVGRIILPAGVKAPDGVSFRLGEGEEVVLPIEFSPSSEGFLSGELSSEPFLGAQPIRLAGASRSRFSLHEKSPAQWEIRNHSSAKLRIWIGNSSAWGLPGEMMIEPEGTGTVLLRGSLEERSPGIPLQGISVSDGSTTREIPAPPSAPGLRVERITPDPLPTRRVGSKVILEFRIANPGNAPRNIRWSVESKLGGGTGEDRTTLLQPDGKENISYGLVTSAPGSCTVSVRFSDGETAPQSLNWNITVAPDESKPVPPLPVPVVRNPDPVKAPDVEQVNVPEIEGVDYRIRYGLNGAKTLEIFFPKMPGFKKVELHEIIPESSTLEKFRQSVENRISDPAMDGGAFTKPDENRIPCTQTNEESNRVTLVCKNAFPGIHSLRICVWGDGAPVAQKVIQVAIPDNRPFWRNWKNWLLVAGLLAVVKIIRDRGGF